MRVPLLGGSYQARSVIADAQRCVNLYPERNPQGASSPTTHYQTPGLIKLATSPNGNKCRGVYRASNGDLYAVYDTYVYYIDVNWTFTLLGQIGVGFNPVSMYDNGTSLVLVDGSVFGYQINLSTKLFAQIADPNFLGSDRVDFLDTFFTFNQPGTPNWYSSLANSVSFSALDFAAKSGNPDNIQVVIVLRREVYLLGTLTSEVWYNAGASPFAFQELPGTFMEHGTVAKYSVAKADKSIFCLSQDQQGQALVVEITGYSAGRISTHAIENEFLTYVRVDDAIGFTYQQEGHEFYVLIFPAADKTWVYDKATQSWHERSSLGTDGNLHRIRANACTFAYGKNIVGDYQNGKLYAMDMNTYTDDGDPIPRIRAFPHLGNEGKRVSYNHFMADIECGTDPNSTPRNPPKIGLRWSDDRGKTFNQPVMQSMGATGQYIIIPSWRRLGMARDRVFELSWSVNAKTALNGAFIEPVPAGT